MSLSKSKCWYLNNCLHFLNRTVPLRDAITPSHSCLGHIGQYNADRIISICVISPKVAKESKKCDIAS